jgi:hypothetical protein
MEHRETGQVVYRHEALWRCVRFLPLALSLTILATDAMLQAAGFSSPKECQPFIGEAHLNCLYRYIEGEQQHHNVAVDSDMKTQDGMMEQMPAKRTQVDELTTITDEEVGQAGRADMPQTAAASPRARDTIIPGAGSPAECRAYSGAAHLNCLYAYIEIQHSKNGNVEEELKAQKQMLGQLRDQMDRQASASQDLQRRLAERDSALSSAPAYIAPPIYPGFGYPGYGYPGLGYTTPGLSLYLGVPGYYWGRPFYGPRYFGHRFGHHHR